LYLDIIRINLSTSSEKDTVRQHLSPAATHTAVLQHTTHYSISVQPLAHPLVLCGPRPYL